MFTNDQLLLFGLSKKEVSVLISIEIESKSIFTLSEDINIPRGTLYPIIQQLYKRGFITPKKYGKRFVYQMIPKENLKSILYKIIDNL